MAKKVTKRNPQDATMRNNRARTKEVAELVKDVADLRRRLELLEQLERNRGAAKQGGNDGQTKS